MNFFQSPVNSKIQDLKIGTLEEKFRVGGVVKWPAVQFLRLELLFCNERVNL